MRIIASFSEIDLFVFFATKILFNLLLVVVLHIRRTAEFLVFNRKIQWFNFRLSLLKLHIVLQFRFTFLGRKQ